MKTSPEIQPKSIATKTLRHKVFQNEAKTKIFSSCLGDFVANIGFSAKSLVLLSILVLCTCITSAQVVSSFKLNAEDFSPLPTSNSVSDLLVRNDTVWVGAGKGLSVTLNGGKSWKNFSNSQTFKDRGISGLAILNNEVWVATAYSTKLENEDIQTGGGLHYSLDRGATWTFIPQPVDTGKVDTLLYGNNKIPALAIVVPQQNVTFDVALTTNTVWITSWAGGLRKSTDQGKTWERVVLPPDGLDRIAPTDTLKFDLSPVRKVFDKDTLDASLNHVMFAVHASNDSVIWAGTANGINKSTDGGRSWRKFNHKNQSKPISGNFVRAIAEQRWKSKNIIWAATVNATDLDEKRGISFSEDGGETWQTALLGESVFNFSFQDSIVYVAAEGGLFKSPDFGSTWIRTGTVVDATTLQRFGYPQFYGVSVQGDTIWVGTSEGLAYTVDSPGEPFGTAWRVFRTYQPVGTSATTYSYPLPFSPDDEVVRIHYSTQGKSVPVTIRIFDFAMQPVKTLLQNAPRSNSTEHDEIWNGLDDLNRRVSNGVYFYRIEMEGSEPLWGKIFVLQ